MSEYRKLAIGHTWTRHAAGWVEKRQDQYVCRETFWRPSPKVTTASCSIGRKVGSATRTESYSAVGLSRCGFKDSRDQQMRVVPTAQVQDVLPTVYPGVLLKNRRVDNVRR